MYKKEEKKDFLCSQQFPIGVPAQIVGIARLSELTHNIWGWEQENFCQVSTNEFDKHQTRIQRAHTRSPCMSGFDGHGWLHFGNLSVRPFRIPVSPHFPQKQQTLSLCNEMILMSWLSSSTLKTLSLLFLFKHQQCRWYRFPSLENKVPTFCTWARTTWRRRKNGKPTTKNK